MFIVHGLVLTLVLGSCPTLVVGSPCPHGSLPFFDCDFHPGAAGRNACWAGVNWGQAADPYSYVCQVPRPSNGCALVPEPVNLTWSWKSPSVTCCNCFQQKFWGSGYCQADSLPQEACNFQSTYGSRSCYPAVNTGQTASPLNNECQVPSPANGCRLVANSITGVYSWQSNQYGVRCCNCFLKRNTSSRWGLSQIDASTSMLQDHEESPKRISDEASMLQVNRASSQESLLSGSSDSSSNPCMRGSLPFFKCDFRPGATGRSACWAGVNTAQAANPNGACRIPRPDNGCVLQAQRDLSWQWKSPAVECCNCFQQKNSGSYCPANSLPRWACDFHTEYGSNACYQAVNTGQTARPNMGECDIPSPRNGCKLVADAITKVYSWQSNHPGINCCNCFLRRDSVNSQGPFLSQMDEASMLQLPADPSNAEL